MTEYYGKYRGTVTNNYDTDGRGKIEVQVPSVNGLNPVWARPSVPFAGPGVGFFAVPPNKANVWVEYEGGNPESPIWSGCFWGDTETGPVPASATQPQIFAIKTQTCTLTLSDVQGSGGINIEFTGGMHIKISSDGIEITDGQNGTIQLQGPKVTVNNGALEVT
jgi:uncharacterized protein involved in type VI secretion and phage assembly